MTTLPATGTALGAAESNGLRIVRIVLGLALLMPTLFVGFMGLVGPTFGMILASIYKSSLLGPAQSVGLANYAQLFANAAFAQAVRFTLEMALVRVLAVALLPLLLVLAVAPFGPWIRWPVRLLFTVPLALHAPVSFDILWRIALSPSTGSLRGLGLSFSDPTEAVRTFLGLDGLGTLGLACGVGLIVGLAALRNPAHARRTLAVAWLIGLLATVALSLQSFTPSEVLTGGGPANLTTTLALFQYRQAFVTLQPGLAAATAVVTLSALMLLGLLAGLVIVLTELRLEVGPRTQVAGARAPFAISLLIAVLLLSLFLGLVDALPAVLAWLSNPGLTNALNPVTSRTPLEAVAVNTVLPPLLQLLPQLPLVYLAALGIGALRPLGRWSEVLLLPFSLWLFVGVGPLSITAYETLRSVKLLDTVAGLTPPPPLSVAMLFVLALLFKGQESHWRAARAAGESGLRAFFTQLILPSIPFVVLLAGAGLLVGTQELLWPLLVATRPEHWTASLVLLQLSNDLARTWGAVGSAAVVLGLPAFVSGFFIFGALQIFDLDRLMLCTGDHVSH